MTRPELLKDNRNKEEHKLEISIESANSGWLFKENYYNNKIYSRNLHELSSFARKILILFRDDMEKLGKIKENPLDRKIKNYTNRDKKIKENKEMPVDEVDEDDSEEKMPVEEKEEEMPVVEVIKQPEIKPYEKPILKEVTHKKWWR